MQRGIDRQRVTRSWRAAVALATAVTVAVMVLAGAISQAHARPTDVPPAPPATLDDLVAVYGTGDTPADLVVVVDTSGSMATDGNPPPWPSVQGAWNALADTVGPNDRVALITFNTAAGRRWNFEPVTTPEERAELKAALPADAPTGGTDIGLALAAAVEDLDRGGASDIQRVVFITDGRHEPPASSPYPADTTQGTWPELTARGKTLVDSHNGRLTAFGWAPPGSGATDVGLVQQVFPNAQILALPNDQFSGFMSELATDVERERVRPNVTADLAAPISASFTLTPPLDAEMTATLTLNNPRKGLPTQVDLTGVTVTEADGTLVPASVTPQILDLAPGASAEVPVSLQPPGTDRGFTLGERIDARDWNVNVAATTALSPELTDLLRIQDLAAPEATVGSVAQPGKVAIAAPYGLAYWKFFALIAMVIAALVAAALFVRWLFVPPKLSGRIVDGDGQLLLELSGREAVLPQGAVQTPNSEDSVRLFTKPRMRTVWIERVAGTPEWRGRSLTNRARKLSTMDTIQLGNARFTFRREGGKK